MKMKPFYKSCSPSLSDTKTTGSRSSTSKWSGDSPNSNRLYAIHKPCSKFFVQRRLSKAADESRTVSIVCRSVYSRSESSASCTARSSYSASVSQINSFATVSPSARSKEAATREAIFSPGRVNSGVPTYSMSHAVVCALQSGVSRHRSAKNPRATCSSRHTNSENTN